MRKITFGIIFISFLFLLMSVGICVDDGEFNKVDVNKIIMLGDGDAIVNELEDNPDDPLTYPTNNDQMDIIRCFECFNFENHPLIEGSRIDGELTYAAIRTEANYNYEGVGTGQMVISSDPKTTIGGIFDGVMYRPEGNYYNPTYDPTNGTTIDLYVLGSESRALIHPRSGLENWWPNAQSYGHCEHIPNMKLLIGASGFTGYAIPRVNPTTKYSGNNTWGENALGIGLINEAIGGSFCASLDSRYIDNDLDSHNKVSTAVGVSGSVSVGEWTSNIAVGKADIAYGGEFGVIIGNVRDSTPTTVITDARSVMVHAPKKTNSEGTITNAYGIYVEDVKDGINSNYGIYIKDDDDVNYSLYSEGKVKIDNDLYVSSDTWADGRLYMGDSCFYSDGGDFNISSTLNMVISTPEQIFINSSTQVQSSLSTYSLAVGNSTYKRWQTKGPSSGLLSSYSTVSVTGSNITFNTGCSTHLYIPIDPLPGTTVTRIRIHGYSIYVDQILKYNIYKKLESSTGGSDIQIGTTQQNSAGNAEFVATYDVTDFTIDEGYKYWFDIWVTNPLGIVRFYSIAYEMSTRKY